MFAIDSVVSENKAIGKNIFFLSFKSKNITSSAKPGQFIHLKINNSGRLLRRPFSIYSVSRSTVAIVYQVVGAVTGKIAQLKEGSYINVIGPIGNGFTFTKSISPVYVAGGVGLASLNFLKGKIKPGILFFGARSKQYLWGINTFKEAGWKVYCATVDGSMGKKGMVTDLLMSYFIRHKQGKKTKVFVCGPDGLIQKTVELCKKYRIPGEASLENIMACGVGACQGCVVEVSSMDAHYKRVCVDGPVFDFKNLAG